MLRILDPSRRDLLHIGGLGAFNLSLPTFLQAKASGGRQPPDSSRSSFGRAKACILLFPYGSPPQHETFDPKPEAPVEIQGEMKAISTSVPGLAICDHRRVSGHAVAGIAYRRHLHSLSLAEGLSM